MIGEVKSGDYAGSIIRKSSMFDFITINLSRKYGGGSLTIGGSDIKKYTVISAENKKNLGDALIGGMVFGPVGAIVGSGIAGTQYTLVIEYEDLNKKPCKSMIQLDSDLYNVFMTSML